MLFTLPVTTTKAQHLRSVCKTRQFQFAALLMITRYDCKHDKNRLRLWTCCHLVVDDENWIFYFLILIHDVISDRLHFFGHTIALRPRGMEGGMECTLLEFFRIFRPQKPSEMGFRGVPWPGVEWPNIVSEGLAYFGTSPLKSPMD